VTTYRIQHSFQDVDTLAGDRYVCSFYSAYVGDATTAQLDAAALAVARFFGPASAAPTTFEPTYYYADHALGANATVKTYKIDTEARHEPLTTLTYDPPNRSSGDTALPSEVAVVMSFRSTESPGLPPARRRGRIYLGPLNVAAIGVVGGTVVPARVHPTFVSAIIGKATILKAALTAAGGSWVVHSATLMREGSATPDHVVNAGYVDNAFDVQRRRGIASNLRQPLSVA
jgi:hypothetical protein